MKTVLSFGCTLLLASLLLFFSCQKSNDSGADEPDNTNTNKPIEYVTAGISGHVTDDSNLPVSGAIVKAGSVTTTTDINGDFSISAASLDKNAGFIKVDKSDYFPGSRTITVNADAQNYITVQLIKKKVSGTVSGATGGNITVQGGGSVVFTGNSFVNTAGNVAYTGTVSVSTSFLNPIAANFTEIMPGTLRGITTTNEETGLQSFGMMAVELTGASGEKLQLAAGKTATLTFPIAPELLADAPATIPLWSFNDTTGLWKEEGIATKQGNNYVGTVGHFSFWNCDYPYGVVDFQARFKDENGKPLYKARVMLNTKGDTISSFGGGYTDSTGWVGGKVPKNKVLQVRVYGKCNTPIYVKEIGPFNSAADWGTLSIVTGAPTFVSFSGQVVNCNGNDITNGFADIYLDNVHYRTLIKTGKLSFGVSRCNNLYTTAVITPYDIATNQSGTPVTVAVSSGVVNVGKIEACGNSISQYLNYTLGIYNTTSYALPADSITKSVSSNKYTIWALRKSNNDYVGLSFTASDTGTVPVTSLNIGQGKTYYSKDGTMNLKITEFGAAGSGYISGSFAGNVKDSSSSMPINGNFRIKR
ncbi:hypothetical protein [Niastella sp. OAS944]|uniref:hypothetical protein n=1 Tax=Niastella sp. OAS944 TaxID=2664089 RepID=UPI003486785B|nr:hypothetical protein [Chitinophagaceae bacterium OAS944]